MVFYRIVRARFRTEALSGDGARASGGRWNSRGVPMVYGAQSRALAILEILVHVDPDLAPDDLHMLAATVPARERIEHVDISMLPRDWRRFPSPDTMQPIGDHWARAGKSLLLAVPSALVPQERCYLLNPAHTGIRRVRIEDEGRIVIDPRLL